MIATHNWQETRRCCIKVSAGVAHPGFSRHCSQVSAGVTSRFRQVLHPGFSRCRIQVSAGVASRFQQVLHPGLGRCCIQFFFAGVASRFQLVLHPDFGRSCVQDPEGRPGMSDVSLLSGMSGLSFDSHNLSTLLFFSAQSSCSFCLVIFRLMVHSPDLSRKLSNIFRYGLGFFVWLLLSSQQMIVGRWYVQLAAIWHWYLPLCIYITFFNFILCLSIPFLYFSLTWYR